MNTLVLVLLSVAALVCGYIFYGGWLCRQWGVGESKEETPAHTLEDGVDYVPAKAPVLMGHHLWFLVGGIFFLEACMILERCTHPFAIRGSRLAKSYRQT